MEENYELSALAGYHLSIRIFTDVKNSGDLRKTLTEKNIPAALLRPCLIAGTFSVLIAANKAVHGFKFGKMKTKNIHTELIYNLSPTHNISDSLKKFGVHDKDTEMLIAFIHQNEDMPLEVKTLIDQVDGISCQMKEFERYSNADQIKKIYKITEEELSIGTIVDAVVCRIAAKDAG